MSQENVELTRRAFDAVIRRDRDAFVGLHDPACEIRPLLAALESTYLGHDGVRRYWDDLLGAFGDLTFRVIEVRDLGDHTLSPLDITFSVPSDLDGPERRSDAAGRGAPGTDSSDAVVEQVNWILAEMRNGRIVRWATFRTEAEALEAVGLRE